MGVYVDGFSMRCNQCVSYRADVDRTQIMWWDGHCYNKSHCKTHKADYPARVDGSMMACFDAELPNLDQLTMEVNQ